MCIRDSVDTDEGATPTSLPTILEMAESEKISVGPESVCCSPFDMTEATERTLYLAVEQDEPTDNVVTYVPKSSSPFDAGVCGDVEILGPFIREVMDPQPDPRWEWNTSFTPSNFAPSVDFAPVLHESKQLIDKATSTLHDIVQEVINPQPDAPLLPSMGCASARLGYF